MAGGKRPGAGRPKGSKDKATVAQGATLSELARKHTDVALNTLVSIATSGESDAARVSASVAILDRGYGKPAQFSTGDAAQFRRAVELSDDELADLASRGRDRATETKEGPSVLQ